MVSSGEFQQAVGLISGASNVLVTSHTRPDGDACGSVKAMCEALKSLGKKVQPLFLSPVAGWYQFLFAEEKVPILINDIKLEQLRSGEFDGFDLIIILDTNSYIQLPNFDEWLKESSAKVLVLDHHITADGLGDVELVDSTAAATGQIVLDLFRHAEWELTESVAEAIFVALCTDTGWFRFLNTDSRCFRDAADLVDAGLKPARIYRKLYQNFSPARMKLLTAMLDNIELHLDGSLALQHVMRDDFDRTGATGTDTESLIDECQRIKTVEAAALFVELKDGDFRCSLRSKGIIDVREIAQKHGGGGHSMAAGVTLAGPLEAAKELILAGVREQFETIGSRK